MKAVVIEQFGGTETLHFEDVEKPTIQSHEVLIKVAYAGVNPVDWKIREGYLKDLFPHEFPIIPGWDVSGKIVEVGSSIKNLKVGDEVFSYVRKPLVKWGSYAEFVSFDAKDVVKKPSNITLAQAAALPLVSLTAWQSLFDEVGLKENQTVLILGGSGGVGSIAIQLAKIAGAKVITTCSPKKNDYVKELGADYIIDYNSNVAEKAKSVAKEGVDVIFDCFGINELKNALPCVKKGGKAVTIAGKLDDNVAKKYQITAYSVFVSPNGAELKKIADLIEQRKIAVPVVNERPLSEAAQAQDDLRQGKILGKLVLKVTNL